MLISTPVWEIFDEVHLAKRTDQKTMRTKAMNSAKEVLFEKPLCSKYRIEFASKFCYLEVKLAPRGTSFAAYVAGRVNRTLAVIASFLLRALGSLLNARNRLTYLLARTAAFLEGLVERF